MATCTITISDTDDSSGITLKVDFNPPVDKVEGNFKPTKAQSFGWAIAEQLTEHLGASATAE